MLTGVLRAIQVSHCHGGSVQVNLQQEQHALGENHGTLRFRRSGECSKAMGYFSCAPG
jgi:hypothetical protein